MAKSNVGAVLEHQPSGGFLDVLFVDSPALWFGIVFGISYSKIVSVLLRFHIHGVLCAFVNRSGHHVHDAMFLKRPHVLGPRDHRRST